MNAKLFYLRWHTLRGIRMIIKFRAYDKEMEQMIYQDDDVEISGNNYETTDFGGT